MKRFKNSVEDFDLMKADPEGEWVRYEDHVEAMKRIAGAPVAQGLDIDALVDGSLAITDGPRHPFSKGGAVWAEREEVVRYVLDQAAPSASAQQAEPVAWHIGNPDGTMNKIGAIYHNRKSAVDHFDSYGGDFNCCIVPLYAAPPVEAMKRIAGDGGQQVERETLISVLENEQNNLAASRRQCGKFEGARWDALQQVIEYLSAAPAPKDAS